MSERTKSCAALISSEMPLPGSPYRSNYGMVGDVANAKFCVIITGVSELQHPLKELF